MEIKIEKLSLFIDSKMCLCTFLSEYLPRHSCCVRLVQPPPRAPMTAPPYRFANWALLTQSSRQQNFALFEVNFDRFNALSVQFWHQILHSSEHAPLEHCQYFEAEYLRRLACWCRQWPFRRCCPRAAGLLKPIWLLVNRSWKYHFLGNSCQEFSPSMPSHSACQSHSRAAAHAQVVLPSPQAAGSEAVRRRLAPARPEIAIHW